MERIAGATQRLMFSLTPVTKQLPELYAVIPAASKYPNDEIGVYTLNRGPMAVIRAAARAAREERPPFPLPT
jgi:hypothetical protein